MIRLIIATVIACVCLTGCADKEAKIETQQILVEVPTKPKCDPSICRPFTTYCKIPVFIVGPDNTVILDAEGQKNLRCLITDVYGWGQAQYAFLAAP